MFSLTGVTAEDKNKIRIKTYAVLESVQRQLCDRVLVISFAEMKL